MHVRWRREIFLAYLDIGFLGSQRFPLIVATIFLHIIGFSTHMEPGKTNRIISDELWENSGKRNYQDSQSTSGKIYTYSLDHVVCNLHISNASERCDRGLR